MDEQQLTDIIETIRGRLRAEIADLNGRLDSIVLADYRTAEPARLQECLVQVIYGLDGRIPNQANEIQKKIAASEAMSAPGKTAKRQSASPWIIQENGAKTGGALPDDSAVNQCVRYLSLPPVDDWSGVEESAATLSSANATTNSPATVTMIETEPARQVGAIPSRLGRELARCVNARQAVACVRKRLPVLKSMATYRFLLAIGYPIADPNSDSLRLCRYLGLINAEDKATAEEQYQALCGRVAHLNQMPIAHVAGLFSLYSGNQTAAQVTPICGRRPQCGACPLTARCGHFAELTESGALSESTDSSLRSIKNWAADERPRERLLAGDRLTNTELLAIILRTGSGRLGAIDLARELLATFETLHGLEKASAQEIASKMRGKGIGPAKAAEICAAMELGRRIAQPAADTRLGLRSAASSRDIFELCRARYKSAVQEEFLLLVLNTKNRIQKEVPVSLGTLNSSIVHPRDVFRHAVREAAAAVIFVHNHPSGDPAPSDEDILLTARLVDAGKLLGIQVLDHVIIGSHEWYSFSDHGRIR